MKLGFFTANFSEKPLEEVVKLVSQYGYEKLEIPAYEGNGQLETIDVIKGNYAKDINKARSSSSPTPASPSAPLCWSPSPK